MSYIGNQPTSVAFLTDQFSGNGSTTAFTMSVAPASTSSILVAVTGVVQDPSTYSVVGTTLTFSAAPPSGTGNVSVRYLGIPASGVTTTAYRTVTDFTATAGQTTFTPPSYTVGYIDVFRNGVRLGAADYTATNGTTVVLASAATAGDLISTVSFYVSSVLNAIPATAGAVNSTYLASNLTLTTPTLTTPTLSSPVTSGTPTGVGVLTSGTSVTTTSGTTVDITSIPSWVKRITIMLNGVSGSGTSDFIVQIGAGSIVTTGYLAQRAFIQSATANASASYTNCIAELANVGGSAATTGHVVMTNFSGNTWIATCNFAQIASSLVGWGAGSITLGGTLDRIRLATANGTDTFDAGSINILYE